MLLTDSYIPLIAVLCLSSTPLLTREKVRRVEVGDVAPEFALQDQNDREVSPKDLAAEKPAVLVCFRSDNW